MATPVMRAWMRATFRLFTSISVTGAENIPPSGGSIVMDEFNISLLDPMLCIVAVQNWFVIPMSKAENMKTPVLGSLIAFGDLDGGARRG